MEPLHGESFTLLQHRHGELCDRGAHGLGNDVERHVGLRLAHAQLQQVPGQLFELINACAEFAALDMDSSSWGKKEPNNVIHVHWGLFS